MVGNCTGKNKVRNWFIVKILDAGGSNHSLGLAGRAQVTFATGRNGAVFGRRLTVMASAYTNSRPLQRSTDPIICWSSIIDG